MAEADPELSRADCRLLPRQAMRDRLAQGDAWALIDGQASPDSPGHAERLGPGGWAALTLPGVEWETRFAPPLLARPDGRMLDFLDSLPAEDGPWGCAVLPASGVGLRALREHLASWLTVRADAPDAVLFRFFDPRILAAFLSAADAADVEALFGRAVGAFLLPVEGDPEQAAAWLPVYGAQACEPAPRDEAGRFVMQPRHLAAFQALRQDQAVPALRAFLAEHHGPALAQRAADIPGQRRWVSQGVGKAAAFGFETEHDIGLFLALMLVLGDGFDTEQDWAAPILERKAPASDRIARLYDRAKAHLERQG